MVLLCNGLFQDTEKAELIKINRNKPVESMVILKVKLHCEGCSKNVKKKISKIKGVEKTVIDSDKDLVTVKGTMDLKELVLYLKEKLKQNVKVVTAEKDDGQKKENKESNKGGSMKEKETAPADKGAEKKEKEMAAACSDGAKVEVNKMEDYGYLPPPAPSYSNDSHAYVEENHQIGYVMGNHHHHHAPLIFSDENPNACSVL